METEKSLQAWLYSPFKRRLGAGRLASWLIEKIHLVFLDGAMPDINRIEHELAKIRQRYPGWQEEATAEAAS